MNIQLKAKRQDGFTIIELVVVILLLGILAATALPRFMDVTDEAHAAVNEGVISGLNSGTALFRATWVATGQPTDSAVEGFGDDDLFASDTGYPIGAAATNSVTMCQEVFDDVLQSGHPTVASATVTAGGYADGDVETAIEGAASATTDYVAILDASTDVASATTCHYYYVGQYKQGESGTGTAGPTRTIPDISYNFSTGDITADTFDLAVDQP